MEGEEVSPWLSIIYTASLTILIICRRFEHRADLQTQIRGTKTSLLPERNPKQTKVCIGDPLDNEWAVGATEGLGGRAEWADRRS